MSNDINFLKNDIIFNYRVAAIIRYNDKILVQKDTMAPYYSLIGGRCKIEESSIEAILREFKEETGLDATLIKPIAIIENFFTLAFNQKKFHEILIIHELKLKDENLYKQNIIHTTEESKKDRITYHWMSISDLKKESFKPEIVLDILDSQEFKHIINKD